MSTSTGNLPPDSAAIHGEAHALLGAIIHDHRKLASVAGLEPADFPSDHGAMLFSAMQFLAQDGGMFDLPILTQHLARNNRLDELTDYLPLVMEAGMNAIDVRHYARDLREYRIRAEVKAAAAITIEQNMNADESAALRARMIAPSLEAAHIATVNVWDSAKTVDELLALGGNEIEWLDFPVLARGHITKVFAPRGTGKSLDAMFRGVRLAKASLRVFYVDRDNPPQIALKRAAGFGAVGLSTFHLMTRKTAPSLKKVQEWAKLAQRGLDLIVIDSWDSFAEGAGEGSDRVAPAMAPLLDLARADGGPAVLILGNTTKNAAHGRGSGVIGDRLDIEFEARDITGWKPSGSIPWHEEMPPGGVEHWASRATRRAQRKDRTSIRLAFVNTKFRVDGDDPPPFAVEIDSSGTPWTERDITDELVAAGDEALTAALAKRQEHLDAATAAMKAEILRRAAADAPLILKKQAEAFLCALGLKQKEARDLVAHGTGWDVRALDKKSMALILPTTITEAEVFALTMRGLDGPLRTPALGPCAFPGCSMHPSGEVKILTTTTVFSEEESPVKERASNETNAVRPSLSDQPHSESEIPSIHAPSSEAEMRSAPETNPAPDDMDNPLNDLEPDR